MFSAESRRFRPYKRTKLRLQQFKHISQQRQQVWKKKKIVRFWGGNDFMVSAEGLEEERYTW